MIKYVAIFIIMFTGQQTIWSTTDMVINTFYDIKGNYHIHNDNILTQWYWLDGKEYGINTKQVCPIEHDNSTLSYSSAPFVKYFDFSSIDSNATIDSVYLEIPARWGCELGLRGWSDDILNTAEWITTTKVKK